jgi:uncharacterized protein (TIGR02246 family)
VSEAVARGVLAALQAAVAAKDRQALLELFDDEVVLFGSAAQSIGRAETEAYLDRVLAVDATLRWGWDRVVPLVEEPELVAFAVIGTVGFDDEAGRPVEERQPFRLTCVAVRRSRRWRLRHFHGSVPDLG